MISDDDKIKLVAKLTAKAEAEKVDIVADLSRSHTKLLWLVQVFITLEHVRHHLRELGCAVFAAF